MPLKLRLSTGMHSEWNIYAITRKSTLGKHALPMDDYNRIYIVYNQVHSFDVLKSHTSCSSSLVADHRWSGRELEKIIYSNCLRDWRGAEICWPLLELSRWSPSRWACDRIQWKRVRHTPDAALRHASELSSTISNLNIMRTKEHNRKVLTQNRKKDIQRN